MQLSDCLTFGVVSCNNLRITREMVPEAGCVWRATADYILERKIDVLLHIGDQVQGHPGQVLAVKLWQKNFECSLPLGPKFPLGVSKAKSLAEIRFHASLLQCIVGRLAFWITSGFVYGDDDWSNYEDGKLTYEQARRPPRKQTDTFFVQCFF